MKPYHPLPLSPCAVLLSGLVSGYYRPRWQLFLDALDKTLTEGGHFNQTAVSHDVFVNVEEPFTLDQTPFPTKPSGTVLCSSPHSHEGQKCRNCTF